MRVDAVTARWTEALYRVAVRSGQLAAVQADVERLAGEVASPALRSFLFDARIEQATRRAKIEPLLEGLGSTIVRNFARLLFDKHREDVLRQLGDAWKLKSLQERNAVEGVVESARALDPDQIARLEAEFTRRLGKEVQLGNRVLPELVAGVRVFVDNRLVDSSVQGRLDGLRRRMEEAPLTAALSV